jgi:hypothetical protein
LFNFRKKSAAQKMRKGENSWKSGKWGEESGGSGKDEKVCAANNPRTRIKAGPRIAAVLGIIAVKTLGKQKNFCGISWEFWGKNGRNRQKRTDRGHTKNPRKCRGLGEDDDKRPVLLVGWAEPNTADEEL